ALDHLVEERLARGGILDGGQLVAIAELDRALQPHAAELARGPGDGEERRLEAAAGHRLRAQPVRLAEYDREHRDADAGAGDEHARRVADQRRLLDLGAD